MPTTGGRPRRATAPGAADAVRRLAPLLDAVAEAASLSPAGATRRLRQALASALGWRTRIVPSPPALAVDQRPRLARGLAIVLIAPGAGALRLSGGPADELRAVAGLCALALARARAGPYERALRDEALTDPLTGLPNRRALGERLAEEVSRARRYRTPLACVMADLDRLKPINDAHGHAAGDRALQGMATVLRAQLRESDFAARAGGDEFVLLLPHTTAEEARSLAARVHRGLRSVRAGPERGAPPVTASFGVASLGDGADGAALVAAADAALYAAKRAGRAAVRVASAGAGRRAATPSPRRPRPRRRARRRGCGPRRRSG